MLFKFTGIGHFDNYPKDVSGSHSFPTDTADKGLPIGVRLSRASLATAHPERLLCNPALGVVAFCDLWNQPIAAWVNTGGLVVGESISVLLVDDCEPWRRFVRLALLSQDNLQIVGEVLDGSEAVQKAEELRPDLILLDIGLPTVNGIEAARQIRKLSAKSRILFVSENRSPDIAKEALSTGAGGYVVKSDAASELLPAIKAVLEGKGFVSASLAGHFLVAATSTTT